jgi:hypothetical protein
MIKIQTGDVWQYVNEEADSYLSYFKFELARSETEGLGYWYNLVPTSKDKSKRKKVNTSAWKKPNWKLVKRNNKTACNCCK